MSRTPWSEVRAKGVTDEARVAESRREAVREIIAYNLAELRAARHLTQVELAAELETTQSVVSRTEHQTDLLLSTLRRFIDALGGRLEVAAVFDDERVVLDLPARREAR